MIRAARIAVLAGAAVAATLLAACNPVVVPDAARVQPPPAVQRAARAPSEASLALERSYVRIQGEQLAAGRMRRETDPVDAPYGPATLARNFERIAFQSEYSLVDGRLSNRRSPTTLGRWERPVRMQLHFGASVDPAMRADDTARVGAYIDRLRAATGHPIDLVRSGGNYHVYLVNSDELSALGPDILDAFPDLETDVVRAVVDADATTYCAVYALPSADPAGGYVAAVAFIRAEHPTLMREACYHEELAQGLGLANDADDVRPSIFNDGDEFALLTRHDELLLRILYDPRLQSGMSVSEARPVVRQIARELIGSGPV